MSKSINFARLLLYALLILAGALPTRIEAQSAQKAIVMGWDGTVSAFVQQLLHAGKLPNLAKLIEDGAFADNVVTVFPSKTASGFASLMTG
ncbi:MAG TPA: alkaline phosphatase family protein, partial [Acidobacteriota bacterium]|nr:alkaline phosphatase family protein [Acidobacteriota bacterium]